MKLRNSGRSSSRSKLQGGHLHYTSGLGAGDRVTVVGLGKIGLPVATHIASAGFLITGLDSSREVVQRVNAGEAGHVREPHLEKNLKRVVESGFLRATSDYGVAIPEAKVIIVLIPLLVDNAGVPNFENYDQAVASMGGVITPGTLIVFETTLPIGTTRSRFKLALERESGLEEGRDFWVAFSPERVSSGSILADLTAYPKIVGGISEEAALRAKDFYEKALFAWPEITSSTSASPRPPVVLMESAEAAEFVKLAETTYRDVNIALANEFARSADELGVSFRKIRDAANSQPFSHIHEAGISVGGHCIPVYPHFYLYSNPNARLVREARALNDSMVDYAVSRLTSFLGELRGLNILILGVTYRPGVSETAFSGALVLRDKLLEAGAIPLASDPILSAGEIENLGFQPSFQDGEVDAIVLHTAHPDFEDLRPTQFSRLKAVVDGRRQLVREVWESRDVRLHSLGDQSESPA